MMVSKVMVFDHFNIFHHALLAIGGSIGQWEFGTMKSQSFRFVGPFYAEQLNFSLAQVATFISLGVFGGAVLQYPLGLLSDLTVVGSWIISIGAGEWVIRRITRPAPHPIHA